MAEELQDQDKQNMEVASQLEKERKEAKKELDAVKQLLDTVTHLLSRKRARPSNLTLFGNMEEAEKKKIKVEKKRENE